LFCRLRRVIKSDGELIIADTIFYTD
jgi:hypothetical protein